MAERTPTPAYNTEPEIRELQGKLQSKQREALAAQVYQSSVVSLDWWWWRYLWHPKGAVQW